MDTAPTRVALVTGGSGGIGRVVAERLARDGIAVAVHYAGNEAKADEVVEAITSAGGRAMKVGGDVADEEAMKEAFDAVERDFGGVDVVVHTAGRMVLGALADFNLAELDGMVRTNVRGTFVVDGLAAQRVRQGGAIVNFSSSVVKLAMPTYAPYAATKGAVDAISLILARELRGRDVTVNAVAPGPTATPLFLDGKDEATIDRLSKMAPWSDSASPRTSPRPWRSSPVPLAGSTARSSTPTAASSRRSIPPGQQSERTESRDNHHEQSHRHKRGRLRFRGAHRARPRRRR